MILTDITDLIAIMSPSGTAEIFSIKHLNGKPPPSPASRLTKRPIGHIAHLSNKIHD